MLLNPCESGIPSSAVITKVLQWCENSVILQSKSVAGTYFCKSPLCLSAEVLEYLGCVHPHEVHVEVLQTSRFCGQQAAAFLAGLRRSTLCAFYAGGEMVKLLEDWFTAEFELRQNYNPVKTWVHMEFAEDLTGSTFCYTGVATIFQWSASGEYQMRSSGLSLGSPPSSAAIKLADIQQDYEALPLVQRQLGY